MPTLLGLNVSVFIIYASMLWSLTKELVDDPSTTGDYTRAKEQDGFRSSCPQIRDWDRDPLTYVMDSIPSSDSLRYNAVPDE